MSINNVRDMLSLLPRSLSDQIVGYAESVERVLPEIFTEARVRQTESLSSQIIIIAGLKKLHWLTSSSFWTLENSSELLASLDVSRIQIGGTDVSRGGDAYSELRDLLRDLDATLEANQLQPFLQMSWPDVVRGLNANEH